MRDPARAAFLGILPGADFGEDSYHGFGGFGGFGADTSVPPPVTSPTAILHPDHPHNPRHPHNQAMMHQMWMEHHHKMLKTQHRHSMLYPNAGSDIKIEAYNFAIPLVIATGFSGAGGQPVLGTTVGVVGGPKFPTTKIKPVNFFVNAPSYGFCTLQQVQAGNVNALIGGSSDAFNYSQGALASKLTMPTLETSTPVTIAGTYTGLVPAGFPPAFSYPLTAEVQGPAEITT